MAHRVCPWWIGYFLVSPLRKLVQNPSAILSPFVASGMTVLELGPGMGFFTLELARLVGPTGRVVAVDVQPKMLKALRRRAEKARLIDRIDIRQAPAEGMGVDDLTGTVDFVLAFAVVHELPDVERFFHETAGALKQGGTLLLAEPTGHVTENKFAVTLQTAERCGLRVKSRPTIRSSRSVVLHKT
jgi:ubiquinone/menaquinone biosynthesis C-methylase UbiE